MSNVNIEKLEISKTVLIENTCNQIDQKINALKLEYMIEWEKNHNFDSTSIDSQLKQLREEKERLCEAFNKMSEDKVSLDLQQLVKAS